MTRFASDFSYIVVNYQKTGIIYLGHVPEVTTPLYLQAQLEKTYVFTRLV